MKRTTVTSILSVEAQAMRSGQKSLQPDEAEQRNGNADVQTPTFAHDGERDPAEVGERQERRAPRNR